MVSDYRLEDQDSIPHQRQRIFPLASVSRPALGSALTPNQGGTGGPSPGIGMTLTTYSHLVPRSGICRRYSSLALYFYMA
jgi:hypothetical protein